MIEVFQLHFLLVTHLLALQTETASPVANWVLIVCSYSSPHSYPFLRLTHKEASLCLNLSLLSALETLDDTERREQGHWEGVLERREIPVARIKLVDVAQVKQFLEVEESALPHHVHRQFHLVLSYRSVWNEPQIARESSRTCSGSNASLSAIPELLSQKGECSTLKGPSHISSANFPDHIEVSSHKISVGQNE